MVVTVENLWKSFGGLTAVAELSFSIEEQAITSLIGPNGAGKTTVFNLLTGFLKPDSGRLLLRGREITSLPPYQRVDLGIARTFQDLRVFNRLSVWDNILVGLKETHEQGLFKTIFWRKSVTAKMSDKVDKLIEFVGLKKVAKEKAESVSYAEQKLMILARTLATDAEVLLLDEPASGLDQKSLEWMVDLFRRLALEKKTILLVEHNFDVVANISNHVVVLDFGQKIGEGTPAEILRNEKVIKAYLGVS